MPTVDEARARIRPGGEPIPLRSHWPIFAAFGIFVWPTAAALCLLLHVALQPAPGADPAYSAEESPAFLLPPSVSSPSAYEALQPPRPLGRPNECQAGPACLTDASLFGPGGPQR